MYMRGRRQYRERTYINRTSYPFHFNRDRESAEVEARYTLYMYEDLYAIKTACQELGITDDGVDSIFYGNAAALIGDVLLHKACRAET